MGMRYVLSALLVLCGTVAVAAEEVRALEDPHKIIVNVSPEDDLADKVGSARPGTTLLLKNGTYRITSTLVFKEFDVWIRSESGVRGKVILDGLKPGAPAKPLKRENCVGEIVAVRAPNVVVADLTVRYAANHAIHVFPIGSVNIGNVLIHNVHVYDCGQQLIKVNGYGKGQQAWADRGTVEDCLIEFKDNSIMQDQGKSFYTGGIDVHGGRRWWIRRNTFRNIQREAKMMEHAVHMWSRCRGTVVEGNTFIDCYRAIGFGMKVKGWGRNRTYTDKKGEEPYVDHLEGTIRNNFIFNRKGIRLESGIELMNVIDVDVYHNTVVSHDKSFSSIEYRWPNTRVKVFNNIVSHTIMERDGAKAELKANIENADPKLFASYSKGDLHLSANAKDAIDKGITLDSMKKPEEPHEHAEHAASGKTPAAIPGQTTGKEPAKETHVCAGPGCKDPNCEHEWKRKAFADYIASQAKLTDIDGEERDEQPDIGADEYSSRRPR